MQRHYFSQPQTCPKSRSSLEHLTMLHTMGLNALGLNDQKSYSYDTYNQSLSRLRPDCGAVGSTDNQLCVAVGWQSC